MSEEKIERIDGNKKNTKSLNFSSKIKNKLFSTLTTGVKNKIARFKNPREYFSNILEISEFKGLEKMVKDTDGIISWDKLAKRGVVKIKNKKVKGIYWKGDLDLTGTRIKTLGKIKKVGGHLDTERVETLENLGELEEIKKGLYLRGTRIKTLGKLKKVGGGLCIYATERLEDFGELERIGGDLYIQGSKLKTLGKLKKINGYLHCKKFTTLVDLGKLEEVGMYLDIRETRIETLGGLKKVGGDLYCENMKKLINLGELEKVGGELYIKGTNIDIQLDIIKRYKENKLKIKKEIYFGGNIKNIEELLKQGCEVNGDKDSRQGALWQIPGILDIENLDIEKQLEFIYEWEIGELEIKKIRINKKLKETIKKIYEEGRINYDKYREVFGENIKKIEDDEIKRIGEGILGAEYKKTKKQIEEKIKNIIEENEGKELTKGEKGSVRKQILELDRELKRKSEQIESFGIKL